MKTIPVKNNIAKAIPVRLFVDLKDLRSCPNVHSKDEYVPTKRECFNKFFSIKKEGLKEEKMVIDIA